MPAEKAFREMASSRPDKFPSEDAIFRRIRRGDHIFIGTGCAEPQHLVKSLLVYATKNPKELLDTEVYQMWPLSDASYASEKFTSNLRHNSFFIGKNIREAVNKGIADYTPVLLSEAPDIFRRGLIEFDAALIQASLPDPDGYVSLGISVDLVKAAMKKSRLVVAQLNKNMPRTCGDSLVHVDEIDYMVRRDEPLIEYSPKATHKKEVAEKIASYVSRLVRDGDTLQTGYGALVNCVAFGLSDKKNLGIHTELFSDSLAHLMKIGAADNSKKSSDAGKTIAAFCMGSRETYSYLDENPAVEMRPVDYTNSPLVIARHENMTVINSALSIDLTGQATEESAGSMFYGGIGGQADFMRGALLSKNGRSILVLSSTTENESASRIMPFLDPGAGVTLNRGDLMYVVTEYGIAYLYGKSIRERAMELISIAHPKFRPHLIEQAKKMRIIYPDQAFIAGRRGEYPVELETTRTTKKGLEILIRPVKISDEHLLKDFFYSLSDDSMYTRFASARKDVPHDVLQEFSVVDYTRKMVLLAVCEKDGKEDILGVGEYEVDENTHMAECAFAVRDDVQNKGIGAELLSYLMKVGKKRGLLGFSAEVLTTNQSMIHLFEKKGFYMHGREGDMYDMRVVFRRRT